MMPVTEGGHQKAPFLCFDPLYTTALCNAALQREGKALSCSPPEVDHWCISSRSKLVSILFSLAICQNRSVMNSSLEVKARVTTMASKVKPAVLMNR